jgi:DNA-binding NtrC family response regulator
LVKKIQILVVDDDEAILRGFKVALQSKGYRVETALSGGEAVEKSKAGDFDLALLDIKLPDMDGTKLLTQLHESMPGMVKIMVTGYPTLNNAVEAVNLGANGYIIKPVKVEELLRVVEEKLKERDEEAEKYEVGRIVKSLERGEEK